VTRHAYDYDKQEWIEGEPASRLMLSHVIEDLELVKSKRGPGYLKYVASEFTQDEWVKNAEVLIHELVGELYGKHDS
jgi:hypothetical protein